MNAPSTLTEYKAFYRSSLTAYSNDVISTTTAAFKAVTAPCGHGKTRATCNVQACAGRIYTPKGN